LDRPKTATPPSPLHGVWNKFSWLNLPEFILFFVSQKNGNQFRFSALRKLLFNFKIQGPKYWSAKSTFVNGRILFLIG